MVKEGAFRNISDTAIWAAIYRARETERPNALFRDPFAKRLTGERGVQIAAVMKVHDQHEWAWVMRTVLFDGFIAQQVGQGVDLVVNLAAGLDARPYRMALPSSLRWVEVDLPAILDYKEEILRGEEPVCVLERVRLDLSDVAARRERFRAGSGSFRVRLGYGFGLCFHQVELPGTGFRFSCGTLCGGFALTRQGGRQRTCGHRGRFCFGRNAVIPP